MSTDGPVEPDALLNLIPSGPSVTRWAFWMRMVLAYAKWWDQDGGRRYPERMPRQQEDQGMGVAIFGSMKKLVSAMMIVGAGVDDTVLTPNTIRDFGRDA